MLSVSHIGDFLIFDFRLATTAIQF